MNVRENLRKNIRFLRVSNKMTQKQVSGSIGINLGTYAAMEEGRSSPKPDVLVCLSDLYAISIDHLLKRNLEELWKKLA